MDEEILKRLEAMEGRLERLERLAGLTSRPRIEYVEPPPVVRTTPPPPPPPSVPQAIHVRDTPLPSVAERTRPVWTKDLEYKIGAKVFPIVGAIGVVSAIYVLVSILFSRGFITPSMLFGGVCVLCLGFVGVGIWKRNEKEEFGQILTGIGSCGLYLNFAAGHVYQKLYEGETLVGLFIVLSFLNLGYAWWRSSRPFLWIGLVGGIIAALMPLRESQVNTNLILTVLIVLPSVLIAARNRWPWVSALLYLVSLLALIPAAVITDVGSIPVAATIYVIALLNVVAYTWAIGEWDFDPHRVFVPVAVFVGGAFAFPMRPDLFGAAMILAYGTVAVAAGLVLREKTHARNLVGSGVLTALVFAPFAPDPLTTMWIFIGLSVLIALFAYRWLTKELSVLANVALALGVWNYSYLMVREWLSPNQEALALGGLIVGFAATAWALVQGWKRLEPVLLGASLLMMPPLIRIVQLGILSPTLNGTPVLGLSVGFLACCLLLSGLLLAVRSLDFLWLPVSAVTLGLCLFMVAIIDQAPVPGAESVVILGFGLAAILVAWACLSRGAETAGIVIVAVATVVIGLLADRLGYLGMTALHVPHPISALVPAGLYVLMAALVGLKDRFRGVAVGAAVCWISAVLLDVGAVGYFPFIDPSWEAGVLLLLMVALVALTYRFHRTDDVPALVPGSTFLFGLFFARLGFLALHGAGLPMETSVLLPAGIYCLLAASGGAWKPLATTAYGAAAFWLATVAFYLTRIEAGAGGAGWEVLLLVLLLGSLVLLVSRLRSEDKLGWLVPISTVIFGSLFARAGFVGLLNNDYPKFESLLLPIAFFAFVASIAGLYDRAKGVILGAAAYWVGAVVLYTSIRWELATPQVWEIWIPVLLLSSLAVITAAMRDDDAHGNLYYASALAGWFLFSRLGFLLLGPMWLGMNENAAVTTAWILTGLILLAVGFVSEVVQLRLSSFVVLFATVVKIVLVDLANTDPAIKVLILMLLGFVMLGGGYWYIRRRPVAMQ